MKTPFLPALRPILAPMGSRTARALAEVSAYTLCQLECCLGRWVPATLFPESLQKAK